VQICGVTRWGHVFVENGDEGEKPTMQVHWVFLCDGNSSFEKHYKKKTPYIVLENLKINVSKYLIINK
jgi:hypothetical protein